MRAAGQLRGQPPEELATQQHEACRAAAGCSVEGQLQPRRGSFHRRAKVGGPCDQYVGSGLKLWALMGPATRSLVANNNRINNWSTDQAVGSYLVLRTE